jgi:hypothetical protein
MLPEGMNATALKGDRSTSAVKSRAVPSIKTGKSSAGRKQSTWSYSRLRVEVAGRSPERRYEERQGCVGWTPD